MLSGFLSGFGDAEKNKAFNYYCVTYLCSSVVSSIHFDTKDLSAAASLTATKNELVTAT